MVLLLALVPISITYTNDIISYVIVLWLIIVWHNIIIIIIIIIIITIIIMITKGPDWESDHVVLRLHHAPAALGVDPQGEADVASGLGVRIKVFWIFV